MKLLYGAFVLAIFACATTSQERQNKKINDRFVEQFKKQIAGHENDPAEEVFKNIQWMKGMPAERFLRTMNGGYSRALGVTCTHCHVEDDFASDEKRPKLAAREMGAMHRMINQQLSQMQHLDGGVMPRAINCSTCHRGSIDPMGGR